MKSPFLNDIVDGQEFIDWKEFLENSFDEEVFDAYKESGNESDLENEDGFDDWKEVCDFIDSCKDDVSEFTFIHDTYIDEYLEQKVKETYTIPEFISSYVDWDSLYDAMKEDYSIHESYYYY